jgi:hypothetical protein
MPAKDKFDAVLKKVLSVSREEMQRRLEMEKKTKRPASRAAGVFAKHG